MKTAGPAVHARRHLRHLILIILTTMLSACGSRSSDILTGNDPGLSGNPLPPCPDSPNCVRLTRQLDLPADRVWRYGVEALESMNPEALELKKERYRAEAVFRVFLFRDDLLLQLEPVSDGSKADGTYLHLRSASRTGYSDLGVNRRRVKRYLRRIEENLR